MSDIKAGDLVMVVRRASCGCVKSIGEVFVVAEVGADKREGMCVLCGVVFPPWTPSARRPDGDWCELSRLKRIDPLTEPESIEHRDEVPA